MVSHSCSFPPVGWTMLRNIVHPVRWPVKVTVKSAVKNSRYIPLHRQQHWRVARAHETYMCDLAKCGTVHKSNAAQNCKTIEPQEAARVHVAPDFKISLLDLNNDSILVAACQQRRSPLALRRRFVVTGLELSSQFRHDVANLVDGRTAPHAVAVARCSWEQL